jgi:hypothetical protein
MRRNFLLIGQSNMSGRGLISEVPAYPNIARIFAYRNNGTWAQAAEPLDSAAGQIDVVSNDGNSAGAGLAIPFANRICALRQADEVGLIIAAKGSSFASQWRRDFSRKSLYGSALARAIEAEASGTLSGILLWQGEAETQLAANIALWAKYWLVTLNWLRLDLGKPALPIGIFRLNNIKHTTRHPYWFHVGNAQTAAQKMVSNSVLISTDDVTPQADLVHYPTAGYITLGVRAADAMNPLLT